MHYTLCDMIADITQNSVEAGASLVTLSFVQTEKSLGVTVTDNGRGMTPQQLEKAKDPFYTDGVKHPGRKIGLGIPFLIQTMDETGGTWNIQSAAGKGTTVTMKFNLENIDTPPVGDVGALFFDLMALPGTYNLHIERTSAGGKTYELDRDELRQALGGDIESAASLALLQQFVAEAENSAA